MGSVPCLQIDEVTRSIAALVLISRDAVPRLEETLRSSYYARHGMADRDGLIHICAFAPGAAYIPASDASGVA